MPPHPRRVSLWPSDALYLIVNAPTGVVYANQVGGTACLTAELEGFLVPGPEQEAQEPLLDALHAHFTGPIYTGAGCAPKGITSETAAWLDGLFARVADWPPLAVDRARLAACDEAWIHVRGEPFKDPDPSRRPDFGGPFAGVVTWPNSD